MTVAFLQSLGDRPLADLGNIVANRRIIKVKAVSKTAESGQRAADRQELLATQSHNGRPIQTVQFVERHRDCVRGRRDHCGRVAVSTAHRLRHDSIDDAESQQILGSDLHGGSSVLRFRSVAPED